MNTKDTKNTAPTPGHKTATGKAKGLWTQGLERLMARAITNNLKGALKDL